MGIVIHRLMTVTAYDPKRLMVARTKALEIFGDYSESACDRPLSSLVSEPIKSIVNGYETFVIVPCGSKEGWGFTEQVQYRIEEFTMWLNDYRFSDGSSPLEWALIEYGETNDGKAQVVECDGRITSSDDYAGPTNAEFPE